METRLTTRGRARPPRAAWPGERCRPPAAPPWPTRPAATTAVCRRTGPSTSTSSRSTWGTWAGSRWLDDTDHVTWILVSNWSLVPCSQSPWGCSSSSSRSLSSPASLVRYAGLWLADTDNTDISLVRCGGWSGRSAETEREEEEGSSGSRRSRLPQVTATVVRLSNTRRPLRGFSILSPCSIWSGFLTLSVQQTEVNFVHLTGGFIIYVDRTVGAFNNATCFGSNAHHFKIFKEFKGSATPTLSAGQGADSQQAAAPGASGHAAYSR